MPSDYAYLKLLVLLTSLLVVCVTAIEKGIHYSHHTLCPMENRLKLHRDAAEPVHFKIETGRDSRAYDLCPTACTYFYTLTVFRNGLGYSKHSIRCRSILSKMH